MSLDRKQQLTFENEVTVGQVVLDILYDFPQPFSYDLENNYAAVTLRMDALYKQILDKFLHNEPIGLPELADRYLILAARLKVAAEQRLFEVAKDKVRYAPHVNNSELHN